ncbi:hypothetical protein, partial [Clostridioides difficile]|uniref:hypothetical protein n=1 Tax=Clostridioides difficile TaxID=1496 RepID=UPI00197C2C74
RRSGIISVVMHEQTEEHAFELRLVGSEKWRRESYVIFAKQGGHTKFRDVSWDRRCVKEKVSKILN